MNLQYFSEVNLQMRPGSDRSKMNIIFEVKEQPTGTINLGGTYSDRSGFSIRSSLSENNFRGTGVSIFGEIDYGPNQRSISVGWTEPWFYERCNNVSVSFWRDTQLAFDSARSREEIMGLAQELQHEHEDLGKAILAYAERFNKRSSIVDLDRIKLHVRRLLRKRVIEEEDCYRHFPSPWSLGIKLFVSTTWLPVASISVPSGTAREAAYVQNDTYGLSFSTNHRLGGYWSHYHSYVPQWYITKNPTALAADAYFLQESLGLQFRSSLRNGLIYSSIDNTASPSDGYRQRMEWEITGGYLGGEDHFYRYILAGRHYLCG